MYVLSALRLSTANFAQLLNYRGSLGHQASGLPGFYGTRAVDISWVWGAVWGIKLQGFRPENAGCQDSKREISLKSLIRVSAL